jgi:PIN domain nuclease of toxin-antitoxin system
MNNNLLLDTHIWLWLVIGDKTLKKSAVSTIKKAAQHHSIYISAISMWEVAMLEFNGRIALGCSTGEWIHRALSAPGLSLAALSPEIVVDSVNLPDDFHKDPADRIIVATARKMNLTLLTRDDRILKYSKRGFVNTIKG